MTGAQRRASIIEQIQNSQVPVSGTKLAATYQVSRQVIVQDIALIRASGYDIMSTNRGYILNEPMEVSRIFKVRHTNERMEDEMCAVVDMGGCVDNVIINHRVYGRMEAPLHVNSRRKVAEFVQDIKSGKSSPLLNITSGYHYHKVTADSEKTLDMIEEVLKEKGFLVKDQNLEELQG